MQIKPLVLLCAAALAGLMVTGCSQAEEKAAATATQEVQLRVVARTADPQAAIAEIYDTVEGCDVEVLDSAAIEEIVEISSSKVTESYVNYSDAKSGLSDVIIIKPVERYKDEVRESLYIYKERRIEEFKNYDILDARTIAQDALVFDQGDYIILLMLRDNDTAKSVIDLYIPQ